MRPQEVETHLVIADGFVSTPHICGVARSQPSAVLPRLFIGRGLTTSTCIFATALASRSSQVPRRPRQAPRHTTRRLQLRHDAPCRTCARLSPPLLLLLERRNPPPSPGSLASELASHNPSPADCFLFDPDAFKSWDPAIHTELDLQPHCCTAESASFNSIRYVDIYQIWATIMRSSNRQTAPLFSSSPLAQLTRDGVITQCTHRCPHRFDFAKFCGWWVT